MILTYVNCFKLISATTKTTNLYRIHISKYRIVIFFQETMVTLGMSSHTDRLLKLMVENGVTNTAVLERLNSEGWCGVRP